MFETEFISMQYTRAVGKNSKSPEPLKYVIFQLVLAGHSHLVARSVVKAVCEIKQLHYKGHKNIPTMHPCCTRLMKPSVQSSVTGGVL